MKSAHIGLIAAATLILAPYSNGAAATIPIAPRFTAFDTYVSAALDEYHVPGAAVAIVENGHVVFLKGYGVSDIAKNTRVDADTVFQLASVSKTFTGVGAAMLVDERKLSWDRPIVAYLPRFVAYDPYVTRNMTVRDLLAHRTGWPKFTGDILGDFGYSRAEVIRRLRYLKPAYSFREIAQYSNFGYLVAGEVSARLAGMSWDEFVKKRIFDPLAMTRSSTSLHCLTDADTAQPY
ncbi:MAG TPA: serine hydrolase domain-containing protein, partial [Candidatus Baltobacteraceae bacterium]|nr:serine hydrolase domain-containing protein [Candidatus Baltobacteraceae bacterium]